MKSLQIILILGLLITLTGCVQFSDSSGNKLHLGKDKGGYYVESRFDSVTEETTSLKALVKGSIYESGEAVSVSGTCLDGDDEPVSTALGYLSAWYPNGTVFFNDTIMTEIQDAYFLYTGPMEAVQGTYLTELRCYDPTTQQHAFAYGEWQNPFWVQRIGDTQNTVGEINQTVNNISVEVGDITVTLGNLEIQVNDSFEITWDLINSVNASINTTYNNLSQQIYNVGLIANGSVDRNDSLLYYLLVNLTNLVTPVNNSGLSVNFTEDADPTVFWTDWELQVQVDDPDGSGFLAWPVVYCEVLTSQSGVFTQMTPQGNFFTYTEFISGAGVFTWDTECYYT